MSKELHQTELQLCGETKRDEGLRHLVGAQGKVLSGNLLSIAYLCRGTGRAEAQFCEMCLQLRHAQKFPFTTNWSEA